MPGTDHMLAVACNVEPEQHLQPVPVLAPSLPDTHTVHTKPERGFCLCSEPQGQHSRASSSSVGAWLTQSLAAIKRRGRSTDDGQSRTMPSVSGSIEEQHQILVDSFASQAAPAGAKADTAVPVTGQHAEQAVKVKRKPGRPRKVPLKPGAATPTGTTSHPLPGPAAGAGVMQPTSGPHPPYGLRLPDGQLALTPAASGPQSSAADAVPAGALMPHRRSSSVQIDVSKLLKSRSKVQPPGSKASGSGSTQPAHGLVSGAIVPDGTSAIPTGGQANYAVVQAPAAAAELAVTAAAASAAVATEPKPKTVSPGGRKAAPLATGASPATGSHGAQEAEDVPEAMAASASPAAVAAAKTDPRGEREAAAAAVTAGGVHVTGSEGGGEAAAGKPVTPVEATGSPAKQAGVTAAVRQQSAASSATLSAPVSTTSPTAASGKLS